MKSKRANHDAPVASGRTIERLLDTAERLFGEHGYDGVGMRTLADEAKVNLGAATYHFGSKKALYIETFMRRFRPLNAERLRLLQEAQSRSRRPVSVETIVDCLVQPTYALGLKHPGFDALLARNFAAPPEFLRAALGKEFEVNMKAFLQALQAVLPAIPENLLRLRMMFSVAPTLMFASRIGRMAEISGHETQEHILKELIRFVAAGLKSAPAVNAPLPPWSPMGRQ